jgi:TonB family protein
LFDAKQIEALYKEADLLKLLGDKAEAGNREEYAYEVARRTYDESSPKLLAPISRLAAFYMTSANPLSARSLLNRAKVIHEANNTTNSDQAITVLRAIAKSHRVERFPPIYIDAGNDVEEEDLFSASLRNRDLEGSVRFINSFPAGERALQDVVKIQSERFGNSSQQTLEALLELADWHLMFGRNFAANTMYQHIYLTLDSAEQATDAEGVAELSAGRRFFANPVLLHFPRPMHPKPPPLARRGDRAEGSVVLQFGVNQTGGVRNLKTLEINGPRNMNFRTRRSMRQAIYRPRLIDGAVIGATEQTMTYRFPYFEKLDPPKEPPQSSDSTTQ